MQASPQTGNPVHPEFNPCEQERYEGTQRQFLISWVIFREQGVSWGAALPQECFSARPDSPAPAGPHWQLGPCNAPLHLTQPSRTGMFKPRRTYSKEWFVQYVSPSMLVMGNRTAPCWRLGFPGAGCRSSQEWVMWYLVVAVPLVF